LVSKQPLTVLWRGICARHTD